MARTRVAAMATAIALGALLPSSPAAADDLGSPGVLNIAHRGASDRAPEHTLAALAQAVADHADRLSIDVRLTRDGVPVVLHDDGLARTTDVRQRFPGSPSWSVRDFTLAQVRTLDAGSWFGSGTFTGARVLTLDELLTELADSPVGLTVEAKSPQTADGVDGIGTAIMDVLGRHPEWLRANRDGSPRLVLESFRWAFLDSMHAAYPTLPLVLLGETVTADDLVAHPYAGEIDVSQRGLTSGLVAAAHRRGVRVGVYTVNGRAAISAVVAGQVDGVTSDEPGQVRSVLAAAHRVWSGIRWPTASPVGAVEVRAARGARLGGRVAVRARVLDTTGRPVPWRSVRVQSLVAGRWTTVGRRATGSLGTAFVSLPARPGMRVRAVSAGHGSRIAAPLVRT